MRQMLILHVENWPMLHYAASLVTSLVYHSAVRPSPLCQQTGALCGTWGEFITLGTLYNDMGIDWMEINDWLAGDQGSSSSRPGTNLCSDSALSLILISAGAGDLGLGGHQIDFWLQSLCWLTRIFSHFRGISAIMMVLSSNILQIHVSPWSRNF